MHRQPQEFTFVDVSAGKKSNTRTIKRHVSNQTNRRKRQEAVTQYQKALLEVVDSMGHSLSDIKPSIASERSDSGQQAVAIRVKQSTSPDPFQSVTEKDENDQKTTFYHQLIEGQPTEIVDYWPAYHEWALQHLKLPPAHPRKPLADSDKRKKRKRWIISLESSRVLAPLSNQHITLHIPRINEPTEFCRIHWALKTCSNYIHGTYEATWGPAHQAVKWYHGSMLPLGIWRESFSLAMEFIQVGKLKDAFFILNAAFNVTPVFFKQDHPGLLIVLLGAMMYTCQISDEKLSKLIRSHITQLSMAHLGPRHPISICLREQLRAADAAHGRTDLLSIAVLDTFADVFGPAHTVALSMRFGYVRRQLNSGEYDAALASMDLLQKYWNSETMPGAQLPRFLTFERARVLHAREMAMRTGGSFLPCRIPELEKLADASLQLPVFIPGQGPSLQPLQSEILKKMGRHLLFGSHYALALYVYSRMSEVFGPRSSVEFLSNTAKDPNRLPAIVARILVDHLKEEMGGSV